MSLIPVTEYGAQLTQAELLFIQNLAGLSYAQGDILYYNGTDLTRLPAGTSGYFLQTQGAGANPLWADTAGGSGANTALSNLASVAINTTLVSDTDNTDALGTTAIAWSDLFLGSGAVITFNSAPSTPDITLTHSANVLTFDGGTLALGTNSLTMTGSIAATGARVTKGWFTDVESTNMYTVGGTSLSSTFSPIAGSASIVTVGTITSGVWNGTDVPVSAGGTGLSTISALSIWVANSANTITEITPGAGNSIRINGAGNAWEAYTPSASVPTTITVADEATDTSCFLAFFTAATGDLGPKTNVNMTFNSNTGVVTFASSVLTTTDINGGTIDGVTIGGASAGAITGTTITVNTNLVPDANDGAGLGLAATAFSDLYLASGALIGFDNGNAVITHSSGILTVSTGDLRVTTAGTNTASVVTVGGTQTLTSKTLTSPTITTASLSGTQTLAENASIALDPAGSADGKYSGITIAGTAGATLAFGDLVYLAAADSRWELADADAASTADRMMGMVVLAAAADGDPTVILLVGQIRADAAFPALTIGSAVYVGETAGDIQVAIPTGADNVIRRVGYALTADEIYFNPSMDSQITVA